MHGARTVLSRAAERDRGSLNAAVPFRADERAHSYFFTASFIEDHLCRHHAALTA